MMIDDAPRKITSLFGPSWCDNVLIEKEIYEEVKCIRCFDAQTRFEEPQKPRIEST